MQMVKKIVLFYLTFVFYQYFFKYLYFIFKNDENLVETCVRKMVRKKCGATLLLLEILPIFN